MAKAEPARPDPDALLHESRAAGRGRLKIFLGAAPGVGKTYAMLEDARRRRREGTGVLAAIVETHGRSETSDLLKELDQLPRKNIDYRGQHLGEMDIDGLIARKPALALVDELAHTNAPGSRHPKRWQDVEEVLASGIDVYSTLNIQHIESLNDIVARITGVRVQETVPDDILARADEIELIDLPPEELIERLRQGKVYVREQAGRALGNFFAKGNLTALRELAMRTAAHRVDTEMTRYMQAHGIDGPWPTQERILVCVNEAPGAKALVRAGKRMADRARLPWLVATVVTPRHLALGAEAERQRGAALRLAESLGAETATLHAESNAAEELLAFARRRNVTRLIVGRPRPRGLFGWLREQVSDALIDAATEFEVTVVSAQATAARARRRVFEAPATSWRPWAIMLAEIGAATAAATAVAWPLWSILPVASIAIPYLIAVLIIGMRRGLAASVLASAAGFLAYNFFFTTPYYSFQVEQFESLVALVVFLVSALFTGTLAGRLNAQVAAMRQGQKRTQTLYEFSRKIAAAGSLDDVLWAVVHHIAVTLDCQSTVLMPSASGELKVVAGFPPIDDLDAKDWGAAQFAWQKNEMAGAGTQTLPASSWLFAPLTTKASKIGLIGVSFPNRDALDPEMKRLISAVEDQAAVAIERARLAIDLEESRLQAETDKLRAALLNSVSHDLRTPLVSIIGAASTMAGADEHLSTGDRDELSETILSEARRLNRYVQNLLDMTKLGYGALAPRRAHVDVREIIGSVRAVFANNLAGHDVTIDVAGNAALLDVDPILIGQALANILDNAAKYAPPGAQIAIAARMIRPDALELSVTDEGPGVPEADRDRIFDLFYRVRAGDGQPGGTGLGLAIAKGFVEAHGGAVRAGVGPNGRGATIAMTLPAVQSDLGQAGDP